MCSSPAVGELNALEPGSHLPLAFVLSNTAALALRESEPALHLDLLFRLESELESRVAYVCVYV